jgi:hypothetical protein
MDRLKYRHTFPSVPRPGMKYSFHNGPAEAIRLARIFAEANGLERLSVVDAQVHDQEPGTLVEKGIIKWTVRLDGLPRSQFDDGSVILLVCLETGEVKRLGRVRPGLPR